MDLKRFMADGEYPITEGRCDIYDALCMMGDYAGRAGETTAVMQYMYQRYITAGVDDEISESLSGIAMVEMTHHELLGKAIVACGGTPYLGTTREFWTGRCVNYTKDLKTLLADDILAEKTAIEGYRKTIVCLQNDSLKRLISRIIEDEQVHIKILENLLEGLLHPDKN